MSVRNANALFCFSCIFLLFLPEPFINLMNLRRYFGFCLICTVCFSCVTPRKTHYLQDPDRNVASYPEVYTPVDYLVQISDELDIDVYTLDKESKKIFNADSYNSSTTGYKGIYTYTVYEDGTIDFPYIGSIPVAGKTTREIKHEIESALRDYVKDCSVEVKLANSYFNIITESKASRIQITKEKLTIFEALAMASDLGIYSDRKHVQIIRQSVDGSTVITKFDLRSKDVLGSEYYYIQPNDIIYVKAFQGQFFRMRSFLAALGITTTTISFGLLIWQIVRLCMPAS